MSGPSLRRNFAWAFLGSAVLAASQFAIQIAIAKLAPSALEGSRRLGDWTLANAITGPIFVFFFFKLRVVVTTESATVRVVGYVRDPSAGPKDAGYVSVSRLRGDQDSAREVLVAEFGRIRDLLNRARELAAVFDMQDELSSMVTQVAGLRERVMNMPEQRM